MRVISDIRSTVSAKDQACLWRIKELCDKDKGEMDQASLASIHESKTLAGIFQHIVDDCRVMKIEMMIWLNFGNNNDDHLKAVSPTKE